MEAFFVMAVEGGFSMCRLFGKVQNFFGGRLYAGSAPSHMFEKRVYQDFGQ